MLKTICWHDKKTVNCCRIMTVSMSKKWITNICAVLSKKATAANWNCYSSRGLLERKMDAVNCVGHRAPTFHQDSMLLSHRGCYKIFSSQVWPHTPLESFCANYSLEPSDGISANSKRNDKFYSLLISAIS